MISDMPAPVAIKDGEYATSGVPSHLVLVTKSVLHLGPELPILIL